MGIIRAVRRLRGTPLAESDVMLKGRVPTAFDLKNKIALVTGAASGIGAAIAHTLARAGAHVVVTDREEAGGQATTDAIRQAGGHAECVRLDLTRESDCA